MGIEHLIFQLKEKLKDAMLSNHTEGILFSGGLDTSILLSLSKDMKPITVGLESYGEDSRYAKSLIRELKIEEYYHRVASIDEAICAIPLVIKILKSFDPAIPNDLVVYFGLKLAKEIGIKEIMTGDGADELFAGYSYMQKREDLGGYLKYLSRSMYFNSNILGESLNIKIRQPYLEKKLIDFSLDISTDLKIREEDGKIYGKWILRKTFEDLLPFYIVWQDKRPLEYGSGMTKLREIISSKISDDEFEEKKKLYPVNFLNKEHLYYYEIYRKEVGEISAANVTQKKCPGCGTGLKQTAFHCRICGHVL
jgi:asparagine synthase (glutamine-hydrolysing)